MNRREIREELSHRTLVLDGALGTMIQQHKLSESDFRGERFAQWHRPIKGCNDILCLTRPDIIGALHRAYLEAGADIITTNSFNANSVSLKDYEMEHLSYEISKAAAELARSEADNFSGKPRFVAGSIGPTNRTASISADILDPASRSIFFDELVESYSTQINGLIDGGVDLLIIETLFDTLNAKAAIYAMEQIFDERSERLPLMISATISDASGRSLSGQTLEALYSSIAHARPLSFGLNCAFGASDMLPYIEGLASLAPCYTSAHPNAGLPNVMGGYDESPEEFAAVVEEYLKGSLVNIIGGCCGTTPRHIELLAAMADRYPRREPQIKEIVTTLSGLEPLYIRPESNFINVGERGNVAGSAKFARLIREGSFDEALSVVRAQADAGAQVIDICMDDGMIEGESAMHHFLALMGSEPEIARLPTMIDSSKWEVLVKGMKICQGKSVVNSISLKEGEEAMLSKAKQIHRMGCAAVVMLFDEQGQADSYERKIEIAHRAYNTLTQNGFPAEDIIFDPNVLSIATGMEQHDGYGKAFIDAVRWIKENLPHAKCSGGVSNLSFSFRGNNTVREAMHSVFLYHAIEAGLDMAIVNAQMLQIYDQIEPELLERVEDAILCRREDAAERLIEFAQNLKHSSGAKSQEQTQAWRSGSLSERILHAMQKGIVDHIEEDTLEGYRALGTPLEVIERLLMPAMEHVGKLFGQGKMFLPQVVKSARVMKRAVATLTPYIEDGAAGSSGGGKVLIATVKGDVHDIGKNIVSVVISCNGYNIEDLGVMVECHNIVDSAIEWGADVICMSGLITPSLDEMIRVVKECEARGLKIPIIIGGATTSKLHTAVKIAPHYSGVVIHASAASDNPKMISLLMGEFRDIYIDKIKTEQQELRADFERDTASRSLASYAEAKAAAKVKSEVIAPKHTGKLIFPDFDIEDVEELIDWSFLLHSWGLKGRYPTILDDPKYGDEARKIIFEAKELLAEIKEKRSLTLQGAIAILPARSDGESITVTSKRGKEVALAMLRSEQRGGSHRSVADFVAASGDHICLFALTAGVGLEELTEKFKAEGDDYSAMMAKLLADRLAEAFTQRVHSFVRRQMWGFEEGKELTREEILRDEYRGVRLAFGYPAVPDHSLKREVFKLLGVEQTTQMRLTESYMISPGESLCGIILSDGEYFTIGRLGEDQLKSYAQAREMSTDEIKRLLPNNF
ncbi:MAG: methionine synthase [Rikenellaceae bacterium]